MKKTLSELKKELEEEKKKYSSELKEVKAVSKERNEVAQLKKDISNLKQEAFLNSDTGVFVSGVDGFFKKIGKAIISMFVKFRDYAGTLDPEAYMGNSNNSILKDNILNQDQQKKDTKKDTEKEQKSEYSYFDVDSK